MAPEPIVQVVALRGQLPLKDERQAAADVLVIRRQLGLRIDLPQPTAHSFFFTSKGVRRCADCAAKKRPGSAMIRSCGAA